MPITGFEAGIENSLIIVPENIAYAPDVVTGMVMPGTSTAGARKAEKLEVTLEVDSPDAKTVHAAGQFNEWKADDVELEKGDDGIWRATLNLDPGTYTYKFIIDGQDWVEDPGNPDKVADPYGGNNSLLTVGGGTFAVGGRLPAEPAAPLAAAAAVEAKIYSAGDVVLELDRPDASTVHVAGEFNNWQADDTALEQGEDGIWRVTLTLEPGRYEYKFVVDGQEWIEDPGNPDKVCGSLRRQQLSTDRGVGEGMKAPPRRKPDFGGLPRTVHSSYSRYSWRIRSSTLST